MVVIPLVRRACLHHLDVRVHEGLLMQNRKGVVDVCEIRRDLYMCVSLVEKQSDRRVVEEWDM